MATIDIPTSAKYFHVDCAQPASRPLTVDYTTAVRRQFQRISDDYVKDRGSTRAAECHGRRGTPHATDRDIHEDQLIPVCWLRARGSPRAMRAGP